MFSTYGWTGHCRGIWRVVLIEGWIMGQRECRVPLTGLPDRRVVRSPIYRTGHLCLLFYC